jgi:hypothetical protein
MHRMKVIPASLLVLAGLLPLRSVHAETFSAPDLKPGDTWVYRFTMQVPGEAPTMFNQEYTILWKARDGQWVPGERRAGGTNIPVPKPGFSATRCLVPVSTPGERPGDGFCDKEVAPGTSVKRMAKGFVVETVFEGTEEVKTSAGAFRAAKFRVEDRFLTFRDETAPNAVKRVWEWWFSAEVRGVARMRLTYLDDKDVVQRTVVQDLVELKLQ